MSACVSKPPQFPGPKPLWTSSNRHGPGFQAIVPLNWEFKPAVGPEKNGSWDLGPHFDWSHLAIFALAISDPSFVSLVFHRTK